MKRGFENVRAAGFDLDQTLYPDSQEIQDRIRNKIAEQLLLVMPVLTDVRGAREYFEGRYRELQSGSRVLAEAGVRDAGEVMDYCLTEANILDLIEPNPELSGIMSKLHKGYLVYLLTSSRKANALSKIERVGIDPDYFHFMFFGDTPGIGEKNNGDAFNYVINALGLLPRRHAYVGDRLKADILPAKNLGMKTIAAWSEIPEADISIPHINDIREVLL